MIVPVETVWHVITSFLIFSGGFFLTLRLSNKLKIKSKNVVYIYIWHTFFSILYMYLTLSSMGGDSVGYYQRALQGNIELEFGTHFVDYISYIFVAYFNLSYLGIFLFFNIIGSIGLIIFYASLYSITKNISRKIRRIAFFFLYSYLL